MDGVERELAHLHEEQLARVQGQHLAAQLAADRATRAGHQHRPAGDLLRQQQVVGRDRVAAEQVIDVEVPDVADRHPALGEVGDGGQGPHHHPVLGHVGEDLVPPDPGRGGHGEDRDAVQGLPVQPVVVIKEAHHLELVAPGQGRRQLPAGGACAKDHGPRQGLTLAQGAVLAAEPEACRQARACDREEQQQRLDQAHRAGRPLEANGHHQGRVQEAVEEHDPGHALNRGPTGVAEDGAVQAAGSEQWDGDQDGGNHRRKRLALEAGKLAQAQVERGPGGEDAQANVDGHRDQPLGQAWHAEHRRGRPAEQPLHPIIARVVAS